MNSLTDLREVVDVVIGVDTHVHTHSAAAVDTATGGVLDEITVEATAQGYAELVEFANSHPANEYLPVKGVNSACAPNMLLIFCIEFTASALLGSCG